MAAEVFGQLDAIDSELVQLHSRTGELYAQRAALMQGLGANGLVGAEVSISWLKTWTKDEYDLNIATLGELGFDSKTIETDVPTFEQVREGLSTIAGHLSDRRIVDAVDELVIAPSIRRIGLGRTKNRQPGLLLRFDSKQTEGNKTYVWESIWNHFADKDPMHDNGATEAFPTAVLLGDIEDPRATGSTQKANEYDEPGLVYTGMTVKDQRDALEHEAKMHKVGGRELKSATVAQIIVANAKRRLEGKPMLDQRTFTRLIHYPDKVAGGGVYVPYVGSVGGQLGLGGSAVRSDWVRDGVRRALGVSAKA